MPFPVPCYLVQLGPSIILSTLFSDTLSLCLSLIVRYQVSQPYKTTGKIIVLHILIFIPLGWNVRSLYSSGSLTTVGRELVRYKLDLVGVQHVRLDKEGPVRAGDYIFSKEKETNIISWEQNFCTPWCSSSSYESRVC